MSDARARAHFFSFLFVLYLRDCCARLLSFSQFHPPPPPRYAIHILYLISRLLTRVDTAPVLKSKDAPLKEEKTHARHHMHIHSGRLSEVRFRGYLVAGAFVASMA